MNRPSLRFETMILDDFDEMLADCPDDERWELISGRVVRMMVGARWEHNRIIGNLAYGLEDRLRAAGSPCRTLRETFRVRNEPSGSSLLPDLLVYCTRPPAGAAYLSDATVVFEVMSPGTQRRDREDKWAVYRRLPSLAHYVLVTRDRPIVETIDRSEGGWREPRVSDGIATDLVLAAIGVRIPLAEIYADVFA